MAAPASNLIPLSQPAESAPPHSPLQWLLGDAADSFFAQAYESQSVVIHHGDPERFRSLLSIDAVDRIIAERDLREGMLVLANAAQDINADDYVTPTGAIDRAAVAHRYARGATIILNQLHQSDLALAGFCQSLEQIFSCHVQTNVYLTPPSSQGFHTHYDKHDVFILQIEGEKTWRLYDQVDAPYRGEGFQHTFTEGEEAAPPSETFVLKPGDCAYLPRGKTHDAMASGDAASLHVTCGLIVRTWAELMLEAVSEVCLADPAFRKSLPPGFASPGFDSADAAKTFAGLLASLAEKARLDAALELMTDTLIHSREPTILGVIAGADRLVEGPYRARPTLWRMEADEDDKLIRLIAPGGDMTFAPGLRPVVEMMLSGQVFDPADLTDEPACDMLNRLLVRGLVGRAS